MIQTPAPMNESEATQDDDEIYRLLDLYEQQRTNYDPVPTDRPEEIVNGAHRAADGRFAASRPPDYNDPTVRRRLTLEPVSRCGEKLAATLQPVLRMRSITEALRTIKRLRARTDELEYELAAYAKAYGWSWRDIADAMDLPRQTVHRRYAAGTLQRRRRHASAS
jgi:DNA-directed RNA polymerase specialized sigma24 family protein